MLSPSERAEGSPQKRPMFIRDGIVISDVRCRLMRDVYAIVTVDDAPLTGFLGDAENPAHTEWSEETSHFKGKYVNGAATLRFVRNAVSDLCQMLAEAADDDDPELLLDVFSIGTAHTGQGMPVEFSSMTTKGNAAANPGDPSRHPAGAKTPASENGMSRSNHRERGRIPILLSAPPLRTSGHCTRRYLKSIKATGQKWRDCHGSPCRACRGAGPCLGSRRTAPGSDIR